MLKIADRLQYEIFSYLWRIWHMRLRYWRPFMRWTPPYYDPELYTPEEIIALKGTRYEKRGEYRHYELESRPWWHLCCNGNAGGWRTSVCDFLEHKWRDTDHYSQDRY